MTTHSALIPSVFLIAVAQGSTAFANVLSDQITAETVTQEQTQYDQQNDTNGRRYKATRAEKDAKTGKAVAIATGVALTARAIPMLASPEPSVKAAGAELMAKAGLEFGQAAASGKAANNNGDQKNLLSQNGQSDSSQLKDEYTPKEKSPAEQVASPELNEFLSGRGINPDHFIGQLTSGSLTDPAAVLKEVGDTTPISEADLSQARSLSGEAALSIASQSESPATPQPGVTLVSVESRKEAVVSPTAIQDVAKVFQMSHQGPTKAITRLEKTSAQPELSLPLDFMFRALFGSDLRVSQDKVRYLVNQRIEGQGIVVPTRGMTIFGVAHRNFRRYSKWRRIYMLRTARVW